MLQIIKRISNYSLLLVSVGLLAPTLASAHVVVTPSSVGIGAEQTFNVSVPNEKDNAVTEVKLDIPSGVSEVTPTEKAGWAVQLDQTGSGDSTVTKSITWTGSLPVGLRDDFSFNAQAPATATKLDWKAYQTYADGSVVHWDQTPAGSDDATGDAGPYSVTTVVNDLTSAKTDATDKQSSSNTLPLILSVTAVVIAVASLVKKKAA